MTHQIRFVLVGFLLALAGCVASAPQLRTDAVVPAGHGVLVTAMHSNWKGYDNPLLAKLEFLYAPKGITTGSGKLVMSAADELKVTSLPAGTYVWISIVFGNRSLDLDGKYEFQITEGTVTYIGDIYCDLRLGLLSATTKDLRIGDNEAETKRRLLAAYPQLLSDSKYEKRLTNFGR